MPVETAGVSLFWTLTNLRLSIYTPGKLRNYFIFWSLPKLLRQLAVYLDKLKYDDITDCTGNVSSSVAGIKKRALRCKRSGNSEFS